ncbi:MAG TPA: 3,4-dihydroxy-2-butanone-4-phosphate synthase [bacterium]|jgi:3,4-dihydroxy 2-butanone 4-phosphate synthase/GTP cyclohydrolase II
MSVTEKAGSEVYDRIAEIPQAIEDLKNGKFIILVDDANRENEGDLVFPAQNASAEVINFYETHVRGWICVSVAPNVAESLNLSMMVDRNTERHGTAFTVTVDAAHGTSTGISAADQAATIRKLADPESVPDDFLRPGHVRPIRARSGGVLERVGHTEAVVDLMTLAGFHPAGILCEIKNQDGSMARLPDLNEYAVKHDVRIYTIQDLIAHRLRSEQLIKRSVESLVHTKWGEFTAIGYESVVREEQHLALVYGDPEKLKKSNEPALVRVHNAHVLSDLFAVPLSPGEPDKIDTAMNIIVKNGSGAFIYIRSRLRGQRMIEQLVEMKESEEKIPKTRLDTLPEDMSFRAYGLGAQIIRDLGYHDIKVITNSPKAHIGIEGYGIKIVGHVPMTE